jgi:ammonium transporter, Amt family
MSIFRFKQPLLAALCGVGALVLSATGALAADAPKLDTGDTAWMLTSSVVVLMMTIPGLALFYGGMVRRKSVLAVLAQCFATTGLLTILWVVAAYSIAFKTNGNASFNMFFGDLSYLFLKPMTPASLFGTIPESVFVFFQMTFAIITPALMAGAVADRMKFSAFLWLMGLWLILVYAPICHMVWAGGWIGAAGALDFAGGTVVHINAGTGALVACLVLGPRIGYGSENMAPHNMILSMIGASLLWVGWFGFNAGSAVAAGTTAGMTALATQIATGAAALSWMFAEWLIGKKPSVLGMISGAIAGLVVITPACGFVDPVSALIMGLLGGAVCYFSAVWVKKWFGYDDSLDAWGVHGVGGMLGAMLTGVFASNAINPAAHGWLFDGNLNQMWIQFLGVAGTFVYSGIMTFIILKLLDWTIGLRVKPEVEVEGLDINLHGETVRG